MASINRQNIKTSVLLAVLYGTDEYFKITMSQIFRDRQYRNKRIWSYIINKRRRGQRRVAVVKTGIACNLFLEMDNFTLQRHIRFNRAQLDTFIRFLVERGHDNHDALGGVTAPIPVERKALIFLWYMANANSFREISDKFDISQGSAHAIIAKILFDIHHLSGKYIRWPDQHQKEQNARQFLHTSGQENIIGAIDGCHISIIRPVRYGNSYLNRKGYYSILLQAVCDWKGQFTDVFIGPPGRVHDARMLRRSELFENKDTLLGTEWKLLGDSAYISQDFPFIVTPSRDNGNLTAVEVEENTSKAKGRVIIENAFGMMKCRFRRIRDIQNTNLELIVRIILSACVLHSILIEDGFRCPQHPDGCPRNGDNDANE